jgi:hypothetical protein
LVERKLPKLEVAGSTPVVRLLFEYAIPRQPVSSFCALFAPEQRSRRDLASVTQLRPVGDTVLA